MLVSAATICLKINVADRRETVGFSSFGVLVYYFIANAAAWTQARERRRRTRELQAAGAVV